MPDDLFPDDQPLDPAEIRAMRADWWAEKLVPPRFAAATVDQLGGDVADLAAEWDGTRNVLLLGAVGVGKTFAAIAMAREAYLDGRDVTIWPVVELLEQLRPGGREGVAAAVQTVDVLVLDDLGAQRPTEWTAEQLYAVVNRRWLEQLPTIVTANLTADDLAATVGPRMASRLHDGALAIELAGPDRRRTR